MNAVLLASFDRLTALLVFFKSAQSFEQTFSARFTLYVVLADSQMWIFVSFFFFHFFDFLFINILTFFAEKSVLNEKFFQKKLTKSARIFWFFQWFCRFILFVIAITESFHWTLWLNSSVLWCREHQFSDSVQSFFQVDWFFQSFLCFLQSTLRLVRQLCCLTFYELSFIK